VDVAQTRALLDEATGVCAPRCVRCVDVEGGTVNRLRDALAPLPSAQAVGAAMRDLHKPTLAREFGELIARAVKVFGFNTTLAPVVDLALAEAAEVLGSRPPGANAQDVIAFARAFFAGLATQGVVGCGKHFPGLGGATGDTHFVTPEIARTWQQIWNEDLVPYRELHAEMPMVMMNHAAYPATPGGNRPASASDFWITKVLRKRIGYRGIILSDDLEMGGILKFLPVEEAAIAAVRAGSDLLEICHSAELILRSYEALIAEAERSAVFRKLLLERARSTARMRARLYAKPAPRALTAKQLDALRAQILKFRDRVAASEAAAIDPRAAAPAEIS
jgi:beta-N-acetylhexosaminidase